MVYYIKLDSMQENIGQLSHISSVKGEIGLLGHHKHGLTVVTTTVFAVGEMAGSGVLALPGALLGTGYIGILLNVVCALVSAYTGMLLGKCWLMVMNRYEEYQVHTRYPYPAIGQVTFGKPGRLLVSCAINFTMFGAAVVFLLLASENLQSLVKNVGKEISFCYWLLIVTAVLIPISWLGTPKDFWPIAIGATVATSIACCVVIANVVIDSKTLPEAYHPNVEFKTFAFALGTICFAYGGHPAFPTFQADMRNPEKFGLAIFISYMIVLFMYLPVAIIGYYVYGSHTKDNILQSMSTGPMQYTVEVLITMHIFCSFIIVINPVCQELEELLRIPTHFGPKRVIFRTLMMGVVLFVAESVPHFGAILSLIGGSTLTLLAYILPPIFYLKLCSMEGAWEKIVVPLHTKVACIEILCVGLIVGVAATYSAVTDLVSSSFSKPCYISVDTVQ
ncbi:amino acid transporter ANTL1-like isoform X2 [Biomphalaria glabrata]|uniref:Amino acid transporter transmembrane domain-containing protein n=1 Tax=Biomphalaria glabrata TaxID=6526 RepID=A0A2C9K488_BIOGL|nr:amino acid transporter ANTL1-like isoform X2 [Biomphalaria glabrata]KAI8791411.1 amino acid transporter ANTL1 isoform X2 [Biomphalaria glabrata]